MGDAERMSNTDEVLISYPGPGQFKELVGVTRKNAIPLLEQMDEERTTRRAGNVREILIN